MFINVLLRQPAACGRSVHFKKDLTHIFSCCVCPEKGSNKIFFGGIKSWVWKKTWHSIWNLHLEVPRAWKQIILTLKSTIYVCLHFPCPQTLIHSSREPLFILNMLPNEIIIVRWPRNPQQNHCFLRMPSHTKHVPSKCSRQFRWFRFSLQWLYMNNRLKPEADQGCWLCGSSVFDCLIVCWRDCLLNRTIWQHVLSQYWPFSGNYIINGVCSL